MAIALSVATTGCGGADPVAQVRGMVLRFGRAAAVRDYRTICRSILQPALVSRFEAVGLPCERALAEGLGPAATPRLTVRAVQVKGATAFVAVHTTAANQPPSDDTIELARGPMGWRIVSLADAAAPARPVLAPR